MENQYIKPSFRGVQKIGTKVKTKNKAGLVKNQDDAIFISKDNFGNNWQVLRTKVGGCQATVMFIFETDEQAWEAAYDIAKAIGGQFHGLEDPRIT